MMKTSRHIRTAALLFLAVPGAPLVAQEAPASTPLRLTATQMFDVAERARIDGDFETAENAYRALTQDADPKVRSEARFRLAMMLADDRKRYADAAVLLRRILDDEPGAARVRVELARMQAMIGNTGAAERELRAAQASGLPEEVEKLVRFYAAALAANKPFGINAEIAIAPDSNINRATASDTLETIIGDFALSDDARETSGIGIAGRVQAFARIPQNEATTWIARVGASGRFYRRSDFDDYVANVQFGPQIRSGEDRISLSGTGVWRWFGGTPAAVTYGLTGDWRHPVDAKTLLRVDGSAVDTVDRLSTLRSNRRYAAGVGVDRALDARTGVGGRLSAYREIARDPGFSFAGGGIDLYAFRELGRTTVVGTLGYDRREADARLFLYPSRRVDDRVSAEVTGTFRSLQVGHAAPLVRLRYEKSFSTVSLYAYSRLAAELGITAAF